MIALALLAFAPQASSFNIPLPVSVVAQEKAAFLTTNFPAANLLNINDATAVASSPFLLSDDLDMVPSDGGGVFDIIRNIAIGITAVLFLLAGLTLLVASFIIPAAAKQLEEQCKELAPELWDEYVAKLPEGTTMEQNPEIMQELGNKLQPYLDRKLAQMEAEGTATVTDLGYGKVVEYADETETPSTTTTVVESPGSTETKPSTPPVKDAEVIEPVILDVSSMSGNMWEDDDEDEKKKKKS